MSLNTPMEIVDVVGSRLEGYTPAGRNKMSLSTQKGISNT